jgi:hypothetical protein
LKIAAGRPVIFKLHPAEQHVRATREIRSIAPHACILADGNTEQMVANCSALVAQYSTVAFTAALLGKEVHSYIEPESLRQALPIQNGGTSARNIAEVCRSCFDSRPVEVAPLRARLEATASQPAAALDLHLMPQSGERSLVYPLAKGIYHALRRRRSLPSTDVGLDNERRAPVADSCAVAATRQPVE